MKRYRILYTVGTLPDKARLWTFDTSMRLGPVSTSTSSSPQRLVLNRPFVENYNTYKRTPSSNLFGALRKLQSAWENTSGAVHNLCIHYDNPAVPTLPLSHSSKRAQARIQPQRWSIHRRERRARRFNTPLRRSWQSPPLPPLLGTMLPN